MNLQVGDLIEFTPWDKKENLPMMDNPAFGVVLDVHDDSIIVESSRYSCPEVIQKRFFNILKVKLVSRPDPVDMDFTNL
mgnify:CR=1 FL=1